MRGKSQRNDSTSEPRGSFLWKIPLTCAGLFNDYLSKSSFYEMEMWSPPIYRCVGQGSEREWSGLSQGSQPGSNPEQPGSKALCPPPAALLPGCQPWHHWERFKGHCL